VRVCAAWGGAEGLGLDTGGGPGEGQRAWGGAEGAAWDSTPGEGLGRGRGPYNMNEDSVNADSDSD